MTESYRSILVHTLRSVLKPLVQILFRAGVRFDEFVEMLRGIYAEIMIRDAVDAGETISIGKISVLSGVGKRDVERLLKSEDWLSIPKPTDAVALAAVLHHWHTDSAFLGPYGVPLELPLTGSGGRTFSDVVHGTNHNIDPNYALEKLLAAKMVARSGDTHVKVLSRTYVMPEPLSAAMLEHFGSAMRNLASTLNFNMTPNQTAKRLEQTVFPVGGLPEELLPEFDALIREQTRRYIAEVDDWLADVARRTNANSSHPVATGVSIFHFVSRPETPIDLKKSVSIGS